MSRSRRFTIETLENRTVPATALTNAIVPENTSASTETQQAAVNPYAASDVEAEYVRKLYADLLGRNTDSGAKSYIDALHNSSMSRHDVAESVLHSDEYAARQINGMFQSFLGRAADEAALKGYLDEFRNGESVQEIGVDILSSAEYQARHVGDDAFIAGVYHDLLGRDVDAAASAGYVSRYADDPSQAHAIVGEIMDSTEMRQRTGEAIVGLMLDAAPVPGAQNKYVKESINGKSMDAIIADIAASEIYSDIGHGASTYNPNQNGSY